MEVQSTRQGVSDEEYRLLVEAVRDYAIFFLDPDGLVISWTPGAQVMFGYSEAEILGNNFIQFYPEEDVQAGKTEMELRRARTEGRFEDEGWRIRKDGTRFWANVIITPLQNADGSLRGYGKVARDLSERRRMEEAISRQAREILEISTPVVRLWEGVVAVPLIGTLDSQRTEQLMERLLNGIVETSSSVALIDITGVPTIDTQTGRHLIETITATRLLGADVVLTGVRPAIAQTLVHLGIDLSGVVSRPSLAAGLAYVFEALNLQVRPR